MKLLLTYVPMFALRGLIFSICALFHVLPTVRHVNGRQNVNNVHLAFIKDLIICVIRHVCQEPFRIRLRITVIYVQQDVLPALQ
jgi:hypothetical protein